jgi:cytochrome c oxidase subunit 2
MSKLQGLLFGLATVVLVVVATYLFIARDWMPPLVSDRGAIDVAIWWSLLVTGIVFILTNLLLAYFTWRYQDEPGARAAYWHDNVKLETTWTLVTAGILLVFLFNALKLWGSVISPAPADATVVEVTGQQFAWNFRYPGTDGTFGRTEPKLVDTDMGNYIGRDKTDPTAADDVVGQNKLILPEGKAVRMLIKSTDVIHSFFLPNFRVKQDAMPGMTVETWFVPQKAGTYEIACAEHCGLGHFKMQGKVYVVSAAQYATLSTSQDAYDAAISEFMKQEAAAAPAGQ